MIPRSFCTRRPSFVRLAGLLLLSLLIPAALVASAGSVAVDAAGNAYVTGAAGATGDVLTVKYNSQGVVQWAVTYDGGDTDVGNAVAVDSSGNVYVAGQSWTEGDEVGLQSYLLVVKYNASGVEQWAMRYVSGVSSAGYFLEVDGFGNAYVAGDYYTDDDFHKMLTVKLNAAGAIEWSALPFYGYDYEESYANDLALDGSGNAYVTGFLYKPLDGGDSDALTVKYSPSGATLWTRAYDDAGGYDAGEHVEVDGSGNVHVAGTAGVIRYNSAGTQQWVAPFDGTVYELTSVDGMLFATSFSGGGIVMARYDATGARLWSTSYNPGSTEEAYAPPLVRDNLYVALGANKDALLVGFNKDTGASTLADLYDSGGDDYPYSMVFTGTSDFWMAVSTGSDNYMYDFLTIKYTVASGPTLSALTLTPTAFPGGCKTSTGKVTLTGPAPAGGAVVSLANTNPAASMPASVTVPAGATTAQFTITGVTVTANQTGTVTASYSGASKSSTLTVRPIGVASVSISPNPVVGPGSATGTVTLECPAAPGNITVTLTSSNPAVANVVPSIRVPAGATSVPFHVSAADVSVVSYANIRATANGIWKAVRLQVNP